MGVLERARLLAAEAKVRHVRTQAGVDTFHLPIGSPIMGRPKVPMKMGEAPIPEGTIRLFHYTPGTNVDSIRQHGLLESHARGDGGMGAGNEPSAGVWASTKPPKLSSSDSIGVVEFYASIDELSGRADWLPEPEDFVEWGNDNHHVIMNHDVPASHVVGIHEGWTEAYHYMVTSPDPVEKYKWLDDEEPDDSAYAPYKKALAAIRANLSQSKSLQPTEFKGGVGRHGYDWIYEGEVWLGPPTAPKVPKTPVSKAPAKRTPVKKNLAPDKRVSTHMQAKQDYKDTTAFIASDQRIFDAVSEYMKNASLPINHKLRTGKDYHLPAMLEEQRARNGRRYEPARPPTASEIRISDKRYAEAMEHIPGIDQLFIEGKAKRDTTVYRVARSGTIDKLPVGKTFIDKGFISTTLSQDAIGLFYGPDSYFYNKKSDKVAIMEILLPEGTPSAYLTATGTQPGPVTGKPGAHQEILLPRGTKFKVVSKRKEGNVTHVQLAVVPNDVTKGLVKLPHTPRTASGKSAAKEKAERASRKRDNKRARDSLNAAIAATTSARRKAELRRELERYVDPPPIKKIPQKAVKRVAEKRL